MSRRKRMSRKGGMLTHAAKHVGKLTGKVLFESAANEVKGNMKGKKGTLSKRVETAHSGKLEPKIAWSPLDENASPHVNIRLPSALSPPLTKSLIAETL